MSSHLVRYTVTNDERRLARYITRLPVWILELIAYSNFCRFRSIHHMISYTCQTSSPDWSYTLPGRLSVGSQTACLCRLEHGHIQWTIDISRSIFIEKLTADTPYLAREGEVWGGARESDSRFTLVIVVLWAFSGYIWPQCIESLYYYISMA